MIESRKIIPVLLILISILVTASTLVLGDGFENRNHKWAISFSIERNLMLGPYDGYGISVSRILSDKYSLRLSQGLELQDRDSDPSEYYEFRETTSLIFLGRINPENRAQCYWGVGPTGRYLYSEYTESRGTEEYTRSSKEWSVGALGILGVEVFANDYIGFHGEYRSLFLIGKRYDSQREDLRTIDFNIGSMFEFGMSIYF
ncbi:MAG TPA: hypothetical protein VKO43_04970 [Candidatus Krumholzibacteriaceae bacterium]|nr:hypothetical protein [Candidatus Krumholzibacteriaceae bacterium]